jgi:type VI protein secretion system component VasK
MDAGGQFVQCPNLRGDWADQARRSRLALRYSWLTVTRRAPMKPAVQVLSSELKKQIGDAMVEFVTKKFPFDANSTCEV